MAQKAEKYKEFKDFKLKKNKERMQPNQNILPPRVDIDEKQTEIMMIKPSSLLPENIEKQYRDPSISNHYICKTDFQFRQQLALQLCILINCGGGVGKISTNIDDENLMRKYIQKANNFLYLKNQQNKIKFEFQLAKAPPQDGNTDNTLWKLKVKVTCLEQLCALRWRKPNQNRDRFQLWAWASYKNISLDMKFNISGNVKNVFSSDVAYNENLTSSNLKIIEEFNSNKKQFLAARQAEKIGDYGKVITYKYNQKLLSNPQNKYQLKYIMTIKSRDHHHNKIIQNIVKFLEQKQIHQFGISRPYNQYTPQDDESVWFLTASSRKTKKSEKQVFSLIKQIEAEYKDVQIKFIPCSGQIKLFIKSANYKKINKILDKYDERIQPQQRIIKLSLSIAGAVRLYVELIKNTRICEEGQFWFLETKFGKKI